MLLSSYKEFISIIHLFFKLIFKKELPSSRIINSEVIKEILFDFINLAKSKAF